MTTAMRKCLATLVAGLVMIFLTSCGGSRALTGHFKDSLVAGLTYTTHTLSGVTDAQGTFYYIDGEQVTFSIGGVVLGTAKGAGQLTPFDITGAPGEVSAAGLKVARLLLTLDDDGNPDNGITIPENANQVLADASIDFSAPAFEISSLTLDVLKRLRLAGLLRADQFFVSQQVAMAHVSKSLFDDRFSLPSTLPTQAAQSEVIIDQPAFNGVVMALDAQQRTHVMVGGDHLRHYVREASGWQPLDMSGVTFITSPVSVQQFTIDDQGYLHVVYQDLRTGQVQYATNRHGAWVAGTLEVLASVVDAHGNLHVLEWGQSRGQLRYGHAIDGLWQWAAFDLPAPHQHVSADSLYRNVEAVLVLDKSGVAHAALNQWLSDNTYHESQVSYASNASGRWQTAPVFQQPLIQVVHADLSLDAADQPHVLLTSTDERIWDGCELDCPQLYSHITHAKRAAGQWVLEDAAPGPLPGYRGPRLWSQGTGLNYFSADSAIDFVQQNKDASAWAHADLPPVSDASMHGMAIWAHEDGRVEAMQAFDDGLVYLAMVDGQWRQETLADTGLVGLYLGAAMDATGVMHTTYLDAKRSALEYATKVSGRSRREVVAEGVYLNSPAVVAAASPTDVHIAYVHATTSDLHDLHRTSNGWVDTVVASNVPSYNTLSIKLDEHGALYLVYRAWDGYTGQMPLTLASNASGSWTQSMIADDTGYNDLVADLRITAGHRINVVISSWDRGPRLFQQQDGESTWASESVGPGMTSTVACVVSVAQPNCASLSYEAIDPLTQQWSGEVVHARKDATGWHYSTVIHDCCVDQSVMLERPQAQDPVMVFYDSRASQLKYAFLKGADWQIRAIANASRAANGSFSAVIGADDQLQVVYFDGGNGDLISTISPIR